MATAALLAPGKMISGEGYLMMDDNYDLKQ